MTLSIYVLDSNMADTKELGAFNQMSIFLIYSSQLVKLNYVLEINVLETIVAIKVTFNTFNIFHS